MILLQLFSLLGSVGLFLYGIKLMSESLQKITGDNLRNVYTAMTSNRFMAMLTGVLVTALVQSSSATMVMSISFINAGLITLSQSLAVFMGANFGMTLINWIIALFGFKYLITVFVFPIIALSLPLFQSNNSKRNSWGELLLGFALLFLGISLLKNSFPDLSQYPNIVASLNYISDLSLFSVIVFMIFGVVFTMIFQSSLVTFIISLLMCANGWISFEMGCAIVLGTNIGSCLTPILAARKANISSKRAAYGFLIFNSIVTIIAIVFFFPFCSLIENLCYLIGIGDLDNVTNISLGIALFHTLYNVIFILLQLPLINPVEKLLIKTISENKNQDESFKLQYISKGLMSSTGQMALIQVRKETSRYADEIYKMFKLFCTMINEPLGSARQLELHEQIKKMEEESDNAEVEIADFLNQISHKTLSWDGELMSRNLYKMVDELESIADSIVHMSTTLFNKQEQRVFFNSDMNTDIRKMIDLTNTSLEHMCHVLQLDEIPSNSLNKAYNFEDEINNYRNQLRNAMLDRIDLQQIEYMQSTYFMLLVNECEKIGDYTINVVAAACEN